MTAILGPLYQLFLNLGFIVIFLGWLHRFVGKTDWADQLKFLTYICLVIAGIFFYPTLMSQGFQIFENFASANKNDMKEMYDYISRPAITDRGWTDIVGHLTDLTLAVLSLLAEALHTLIMAIAKALAIVLKAASPLMLACLCFPQTLDNGVRFVKYSLILMLVPIGMVLIDYLVAQFILEAVNFMDWGSPKSIENIIVQNLKKGDYHPAPLPEGEPHFLLTSLLSVASFCGCIGYVFSPKIFSLLLSGGGVHEGLKAAGQAAMKPAAVAGKAGAAGAGGAIGEAGRQAGASKIGQKAQAAASSAKNNLRNSGIGKAVSPALNIMSRSAGAAKRSVQKSLTNKNG